MRRHLMVAIVFLAAAALFGASNDAFGTTLGAAGSRFTINGRPAFLLGISYYGGLGAPDAVLKRDLDAMQRHGINWLRVWATWSYRGDDVSALDAAGRPRAPYMGRLKHLVTECDRHGLVVDVTLSRGRSAAGGGIPDMAAHRTAVRSVIEALAGHRNWYLDLANERDVRDMRYVSTEELRELRELARSLSPELLVTASFGGHDLDDRYVREALVDAHLDFVAPHRPRQAGSPAQTEQQTRQCIATMDRISRVAPIQYQEPFRRGYSDWEPRAEDFAADLQGARAGGAAGWCFHNGDTRRSEDRRPWRCFDLRHAALFDQLDAEERRFVEGSLRPEHAVAAPARGSGALSVLPSNPYYFQDARGRPVVLVGDYTWGTFSDVNFDYVRALDSLHSRGLNTARVWLWWGCEEITTDPIPARHVEPFLRPGPGLANDGRPKYDLARFNPAFFDRLTDFCRAARQRGIQLQLIAMDAWMLKHAELWKIHAFQRDNNINGVDGDPAHTGTGIDGANGFCSLRNPGAMEYQKALVRKIVETTNAFDNVRYEIANENYYSAEWELALCDYINDIEKSMPREHLTMRRDLPLHSDVVQRWEPALVRRGMLARRNLRQPLIFDTDWTINKSDDEVRAAMWTALVSGGHFTYMDDALEYRIGKPYKDPRLALHRQIDFAAAFMKRIAPWEMTPDDALVRSGTAYAMASIAQMAAYLPHGGRAVLDLSRMTGERRARWYSTRDGRFGAAFVVQAGARAEVEAPDAFDWALLVD